MGSQGTGRLCCRRGSNVALMLDVRSLGAVEPICSVRTPQEVTLHFLRTAGHPLTRRALQHQPPSPKQLEEEFLVRTWGPLRITALPNQESQLVPLYPGLRACPLWALGRESPGVSRKEPAQAPSSALHHIWTRVLMPGGNSWVPALLGKVEGEEAGRGLAVHLLPPPARRSPQTLSALKTWIFLAMPPRTDTRPSCQVRTAAGAWGWRRSEGKTQPRPGESCRPQRLFFRQRNAHTRAWLGKGSRSHNQHEDRTALPSVTPGSRAMVFLSPFYK